MERLKIMLFTLRSLTFNSATSRVAVVDTIFEPVFWIVDHFVRILGPVSNSYFRQVIWPANFAEVNGVRVQSPHFLKIFRIFPKMIGQFAAIAEEYRKHE